MVPSLRRQENEVFRNLNLSHSKQKKEMHFSFYPSISFFSLSFFSISFFSISFFSLSFFSLSSFSLFSFSISFFSLSYFSIFPLYLSSLCLSSLFLFSLWQSNHFHSWEEVWKDLASVQQKKEQRTKNQMSEKYLGFCNTLLSCQKERKKRKRAFVWCKPLQETPSMHSLTINFCFWKQNTRLNLSGSSRCRNPDLVALNLAQPASRFSTTIATVIQNEFTFFLPVLRLQREAVHDHTASKKKTKG